MVRLSLLTASLQGAVAIAAVNCTFDAVSAILPSNISLSFVQTIPENGTFIVPSEDTGWPINPINLPALCAIGATVPGNTENATYGFGLFLPTAWNGRTL